MPTLTPSSPPPPVEAGPAGPAAARRCLNCGAEVGDAFCGRCGQAADTERMRFPRLMRELAGGLLSLDLAVARTFRALVTRPGPFIREYLLGRRVGFSGPLPYYVLAVAVNIGASALIGELGLVPGGHRAPDESFWDRNFVPLQFSVVFAALLLPLAVGQRLLHRRAGWSLAEHYALLLYVLAQSWLGMTVVTLALLPFGASLSDGRDGPVWLVLFNVYLLWTLGGFFADRLWKSALKVLGAYAVLFGFLMIGSLLWIAVSPRARADFQRQVTEREARATSPSLPRTAPR